MAYAFIKEGSLPKTCHSWNNTCQGAGFCGVSMVYHFTFVLNYSGACTFIILNMWPSFNCSTLYSLQGVNQRS